MLLGTVQITGETLGEAEVDSICESLRDNSIRLLSLRECTVRDQEYKKLVEGVKENDSLVQLNLNLGICNGKQRIRWLAEALTGNKSLNALFLHGTHLGDHGLEVLTPAIRSHPNLQSLDLGDCHIGDEGIKHICNLLQPAADDKEGIQDLTLSANHSITAYGWSQLAMAIAANSQIKGLYLDYNHIGDYGAGIFSVAMAANRNLERLDLEGTGITDKGGKLLAYSIKNHCKKLQELVLAENPISEDLVESITDSLMFKASESIENGHDTSHDNSKTSENGSPRIPKQSPHNEETQSIAETK